MTSEQAREAGRAEQATPAPPHPRAAELLAAARAAAIRGAAVLRDHAARHTTLEWEAKTRTDFVSVADRDAEAAVVAVLAEHAPDATVLAEEGSPDASVTRGAMFVVDPLDGTTNFLHGFPWYAVSVGALVDGRLVAGAAINAATGELFTASAGGGAWRELAGDAAPPRRIAVSAVGDPARALLGTGLPFKHPHHVDPYLRALPRIFTAVAGVRRPGAAVLDLCDVACGRFEAFWELELQPWDMAAGTLIVCEAGGVVTDLAGRPAEVRNGPVVAGNPAMHRWLLDVLGETGTVAALAAAAAAAGTTSGAR